MKSLVVRSILVWSCVAFGCSSRPAQPKQAPPPASPREVGSESRGAAGAPTAQGPASEGAAGSQADMARARHCPNQRRNFAVTQGAACGPLDCRAFAGAEDALAYVLRETSPLVLAVGEIHAQKDTALAASPTQRFAELLPLFCGVARHIVIELWTGRNDCGDRRVDEVQKAQEPVTKAQAATNKNDFYELGNVAKANRIQPHALTPSCEDFRSIVAAKEDDVIRMLELTATRTAELTDRLLAASHGAASIPQVLLYGGAMHNDLAPAAGRESFSYGPRLAASTGGRLTELDVVLREQVRDSDSFRRLPWYEHFRGETLEKQFTLYRLGPRSFTLIYPKQPPLP